MPWLRACQRLAAVGGLVDAARRDGGRHRLGVGRVRQDRVERLAAESRTPLGPLGVVPQGLLEGERLAPVGGLPDRAGLGAGVHDPVGRHRAPAARPAPGSPRCPRGSGSRRWASPARSRRGRRSARPGGPASSSSRRPAVAGCRRACRPGRSRPPPCRSGDRRTPTPRGPRRTCRSTDPCGCRPSRSCRCAMCRSSRVRRFSQGRPGQDTDSSLAGLTRTPRRVPQLLACCAPPHGRSAALPSLVDGPTAASLRRLAEHPMDATLATAES